MIRARRGARPGKTSDVLHRLHLGCDPGAADLLGYRDCPREQCSVVGVAICDAAHVFQAGECSERPRHERSRSHLLLQPQATRQSLLCLVELA